MNTINEKKQELIKSYQLRDKLRAKIEKHEQQIERLKKRMHRPFWGDYLVKPIADALLPMLTDFDRYDLLGPFGLNCEYSIHFYRKGVAEPYKNLAEGKNVNIKSLTFVPCDLTKGEIKLVNFNVDTKQYPENSIGAINSMNHPAVDIPENNMLEFLLDWLNK